MTDGASGVVTVSCINSTQGRAERGTFDKFATHRWVFAFSQTRKAHEQHQQNAFQPRYIRGDMAWKLKRTVGLLDLGVALIGCAVLPGLFLTRSSLKTPGPARYRLERHSIPFFVSPCVSKTSDQMHDDVKYSACLSSLTTVPEESSAWLAIVRSHATKLKAVDMATRQTDWRLEPTISLTNELEQTKLTINYHFLGGNDPLLADVVCVNLRRARGS